MKKTVSIKENREFRRIYSKGTSVVTPHMVVYYRPNRLGYQRLGLTASTKLGNAVVRNRVRRRLREIFRLQKNLLINSVDIVIVARSRATTADYFSLEKSFFRCMDKLGLLAERKQP